MRNKTGLCHWGRVTHIYVSKLTIIGSDNGLSPCRRQAIIWTNAGILLIRTLGTNFSEILSKIPSFSFKKMHLKMSSAKWRPFCLGLNVLSCYIRLTCVAALAIPYTVTWLMGNLGNISGMLVRSIMTGALELETLVSVGMIYVEYISFSGKFVGS